MLGPDRVVVGMPVHPEHLAAQRARGPHFEQHMAVLEERATPSGARFLRLEALDLPTAETWLDGAHLTRAGAKVFSQWLGERVGDAVKQGLIPDPTARS